MRSYNVTSRERFSVPTYNVVESGFGVQRSACVQLTPTIHWPAHEVNETGKSSKLGNFDKLGKNQNGN